MMRYLTALDHFRDRVSEKAIYNCNGNRGNGCFQLPSPIDRGLMLIVASDGDSWDHVSVSRGNRCPNWPEMEYIKRLFFADDETAMQLHVPITDHINLHPYTLHLWRPQQQAIPRPPTRMV